MPPEDGPDGADHARRVVVANWPLGSALSMIMLVGTLVLVAIAARMIDIRQLIE
jgi:ABC-type spermidine/putrescine transport system permease subunit I